MALGGETVNTESSLEILIKNTMALNAMWKLIIAPEHSERFCSVGLWLSCLSVHMCGPVCVCVYLHVCMCKCIGFVTNSVIWDTRTRAKSFFGSAFSKAYTREAD